MSQLFNKYFPFLLYLTFLCLPFSAQAQDKDIKEVVKTADLLFEQKKYSEAKDLFSQLVSLYPKDENYNYKFGACLLFVESDKTAPIKFLEYAVSRPNVDPAAFYFLGKGYHYNYRFDEAIVYFNKYKDKLDPKSKNVYPADHDIRYCENGKGLLTNISSPHVSTKKKVRSTDFYVSYKLSSMGVRILAAPSELQSSYDKTMGYTPIMFRASGKDEIYFASYGSNGKTGLDIYVVRINADGDLEKPTLLPPTINTKYDDAFPFLSEDGTEFYFASKGHNSMGGYDIFKSVPNTTALTFSAPENLDYSINTPDDDFMYAIDRNEGYAYFSSTRNCENDKTYVYKIDASRENYKIAILAGVFESKDTKSCKITVEDLNTHLEIGSFSTDKKDGQYLMRLQNGGSYNFLVEPYGGNIAYKGRVDLPYLPEMKLLKQEIEIVSENGNERLIIRNLFEEVPASGDDAIMAKVLMQDANIEEYKEPKITISNAEMISELEKSKQKIQKKIDNLNERAALSYGVAMEKREVAQRDLAMADQLESQISLNDNTEESAQKQKELDQLLTDAKQHSLEAESAFMVGKDLEELAKTTQNDLNEAEGYLIRIQNAVSDNEVEKAQDLYKGYVASNNTKKDDGIQAYLGSELKSAQKKSLSSLKRAENTEKAQVELKSSISQKKAEQNATKKKKVKEEIQVQIDDLEEELAPLAEEIDAYYKEARKHESEAQKIERKIAAVESIEEKEATPNVVIPEVSEEQKSALITSIEATNDEIVALEEEKSNQNQEVSDATQELATGSGTNEGVVQNQEELEISEATAENEIAENQNETQPTGSDLSEETVETNSEPSNPEEGNVAGVGGAEVAIVGGAINNDDSENLTETENENELANNSSSETEGTGDTESTEAISENSGIDEGYFAYTESYEEEIENPIMVDGTEIPKVITENTGKKRYKTEELENAQIVLGTSGYNKSFERKVQSNLEETDAKQKALNNQKLNYEWVVAIEKEIAEIKYAAANTTNASYKYNMNNKVSELNEQANQKRNFMKLNAQIINQLESDDFALETENQGAESETEVAQETETQEIQNSEELIENEEGIGTSEALTENTELTSENEGAEETGTEGIENNTPEEVAVVNSTEGEESNEEGSEEGNTNTTEEQEGQTQTSENIAVNTEENLTEGTEPNVNEVEGTEELANQTENTEVENQEEQQEGETQNEEEIAVNSEEQETENAQENSEESSIGTENETQTESSEELASREAEKKKEQNLVQLSSVKGNLAVAEPAPSQEQIFPSETVVAQVEEQKVQQAEVVQVRKSDLSSLQNELEITKKKKTKRAIEQQIKVKEAEVEYEQKRLILLNQKSKNVVLAQDSMMANPLSERPSVAKYNEAQKIRKQYAQLESEKSDLEITLSETKKKKTRRVLEAEIQNISHEMKLSQIEAEVAQETAQEMEKVEVATLKKSTKYGREEIVKLPTVPRELSVEETESTETLPEYKEYEEAKTESQRKIQEADVLYAQSEAKKVEVQRANDELALLIALAEDMPLAEQDSVLEIINIKVEERKKLIQEAEVQYQEATVLNNDGYFELNEANSGILTLENGDEKIRILALIGGNMAPEEVVYDSSNINEIPAELNNDIFVDSDSTFYSSENPIPVDVKLPSGVILKVQIGAFRNPINQETFKGFAPIVGEKTATGLTRYTAGMFKDFATANNAKDGIRAKGYTDAFVVAYLDGKRISISEARRVLSGELTAEQVGETPAQAVPLNDVIFNVQTIESEVVQQANPQVSVQQAADRGDLFFTVQVGVYSSRISPSTVFSITPLNSENIANGLVRYSSGVYGSLAEAINSRNRIVRGGISDAFVTAYRNGNRISIAEAKALGTTSGTPSFTQEPDPVQEQTEEPDLPTENTQNRVTYHIEVGPYSGNIPIEQAKELLSLSALGVIVEKNNGATLYKIGNFTTINEANQVRNNLVSKGLTNPVVKESGVQ